MCLNVAYRSVFPFGQAQIQFARHSNAGPLARHPSVPSYLVTREYTAPNYRVRHPRFVYTVMNARNGPHMSNIANIQGALYTEAMGTASGAPGACLQTIRQERKLEPKGVLPQLSERLIDLLLDTWPDVTE
jgi:hypothetical protein